MLARLTEMNLYAISPMSKVAFHSRLPAWRISFALNPYAHHHTYIKFGPSFGYAVATPACNPYETLYQPTDVRMYHDQQLIKGQHKMFI